MRKLGLLCSLVMLTGLAVLAGAGDGRFDPSSLFTAFIASAEAQQTSTGGAAQPATTPAPTPAAPTATPAAAPATTPVKTVTAPAGSAVTADQARQTLDVLQDDTKRKQLIQVLQTIATVPGATVPGATVPVAAGAATPATPAPTTPAPAATPPSTPAQSVLPVPLEADSLGAQLLEQGASWLDDAADAIGEAMHNAADLPRVWTWLTLTLQDPTARIQFLSAVWRLAVVIGCAVLAEYCLRFLLRKPLYFMERRAAYLLGLIGLGGATASAGDGFAPDSEASDPAETTPSDIDPGAIVSGVASNEHEPEAMAGRGGIIQRDASGLPKKAGHGWLWARRIPWAILHFLVSLLPVVLFAVVGNSLLGTDLGHPKSVRLAGLAAVNAYVLVRAITYVVQLIVMSRVPGLRLLPIRDESAAYIEIWSWRIVGTGLFGAALAEMALLLGLSRAGHDTLLKVVFLVVAIYVVIIILQSRHTVANWLRARPGRHGPVAVVLNRMASLWHVFAICLVLALWLVWALEIHHGFAKLLHFSALFLGILIVARLFTMLLHLAFDRLFRIDEQLEKRFPGLKQRANRYYPLLRGAISVVVTIFSVIALLQAWGLDAFAWFHSDEIGSRLLSAIITIAVASIVACGIWEGSNLAIDRHMMKLDRSGDYAHAARLRTLVPILKTVLLVVMLIVVLLTILSQIGVDIAPLLAGASIIGVAIGFGSQKLVQDFITGIFLLLENAMQVGDSITASGLSGTVEKLSIRTIRLRAGDGAVHIIPFSSVGTVTNTNRGVGNAAVKVSVKAGEDYDKVGEALKAIAREMRSDDNFRHMMRSDLQLWGVDEVHAGVITIAGQIVCSDTGRWGVQREFNRRLLKRFAELGIMLAGPAHYVVLANGDEATAESDDSAPDDAAEAAMTDAPEKSDSATSVRNSPPPSALGHTE